MRGPMVRLLEAGFYENFIETAGEVTPELDDPPQRNCTQAGASMVIRSSPTGGSNDLKRLYLLAIASARHTIDITCPYFVTDESSDWAFRDAVARGVKIRILVEGDSTDAMPVKYASREAYDDCWRCGIEIYEYQPTMMHTKTLVVDGTWSMFGSANFDNRSLELNDELNVAVSSRGPRRAAFWKTSNRISAAAHASICSSGGADLAREVARTVLVLLRGGILSSQLLQLSAVSTTFRGSRGYACLATLELATADQQTSRSSDPAADPN